MDLHEYVSQLIIDTKGAVAGGLFSPPAADSSLGLFLPEIILCATIVLILFSRLFPWSRRVPTFWLTLAGTALALYATAPWTWLGAADPGRTEIFTGMLVFDGLTVFMRTVLLLFTVLLVVFTRLSGIPDRDDSADIYALFLGATLGMCLMVSANHLLMVFLAVEMASVPSYVLAGILKGRRQSSEAALKYAVYGAGAAGAMLYGISLVCGLLDTAHLPTVTQQLSERLPHMGPSEATVLALAVLLIMVGLAFKLSAVPFHFWCPDVFEGACAEVDAFLSVASKAAALTLLVRVTISLGALTPAMTDAGRLAPAAASLPVATAVSPVSLTASPEAGLWEAAAVSAPPPAVQTALQRMRNLLGKLVALLAAVTCTFGNLAAYGQTNIKRLLAYSTIAHAGYMMMAVPAVMAMAGTDPAGAQQAVAALAIYIAVYLFMNLGAFATVALLRNEMRSEQISDYAGLLAQAPGVVICFCLTLFGLIGLPPLSGFIGKFAVFAALANGFQATSQTYLLALLLVGALNTAISLFFYLRVIRVMTMASPPASRPPVRLPMLSPAGVFLLITTAPTALFILNWNGLNQWAQAAASHLLLF